MPSDAESLPSAELLADGLSPVLQALVARTARDVDGWGVLNPPPGFGPLVVVIKCLSPNLYERAPLEALRLALERAVLVIGNERFEINGRSMNYGSILPRLIGATPIYVRRSGKRYDQLLTDVKAESGTNYWPTSQANRLTSLLRQRLAQALLQIAGFEQGGITEGSQPPRASKVFVERPSLMNSARDALLLDARCLVLWGESGNGKSMLARELAKKAASEISGSVVIIRGPNDAESIIFVRDVHEAVRTQGHDNSSWSHQQNMSFFERLLRLEGAFRLVVFDNMDYATVELLVPLAKVPIIVTTPRRMTDIRGEHIRINGMEPEEALALATAALPFAPTDELELLTALLGQRPLPIYIASRLVAAGHETLPKMIGSLQVNTTGTIDAAEVLLGERADVQIIEVYRKFVEILNFSPSLSHVAKQAIWLIGSGLFNYLVEFSIETWDGPRMLTSIEVRGAIAELDSLGIIDNSLPDFVEINSLTWKILRELTLGNLPEVLGAITSRVLRPSHDIAQRMTAQEGDPEAWNVFWASMYDADSSVLAMMRRFQMQVEWSRLRFNPGRRCGALSTTSKIWIFWQRGPDILFDSTLEGEAMELGLATVDVDGLWVWTQGRSVAVRGDKLREVYNECRWYSDRVADFTRRTLGPSSNNLFAMGKGEVRLDCFPYLENSPLQHDYHSRIPRFLLCEFEIVTWSACGEMVAHSDEEEFSRRVDCPDCLRLLESPDGGRTSTFAEISRILERADAQIDWELECALHDLGSTSAAGLEQQSDHLAAGLERLGSPPSADLGIAEIYETVFFSALHGIAIATQAQPILTRCDIFWNNLDAQTSALSFRMRWIYCLTLSQSLESLGRYVDALNALVRCDSLLSGTVDEPRRAQIMSQRKFLERHIEALPDGLA